jgi:hypothetical protein
MKLTIQKAVVFLAGAVCLSAVAFSILTLRTFPPINLDEVSNTVMADYFWRTGKIICPLVQGVIHPYFADLNSVDQTSLRGLHLFILGAWERIVGLDFVSLRALSLVCWVLTAFLWGALIRRFLGTAVAAVSVCIWTLSFDARLAAHLIRPDMLLALVFAVLLSLVFFRPPFSTGMKWFLIGGLSVLAASVHPNGLLMPALMIVLFVLTERTSPNAGALALHALAGAFAGFLVFCLLADFPSFSLSRYGYVSQVFSRSGAIWKERLLPWNLIGDVGLYYLRPTSFYAREPLFNNNILFMAGLAQLGGYGLLLLAYFRQRAGFLKNVWITAGFLFLGLSLGRFRGELVYNMPLTLLSAPLLASLMMSSWEQGAAQWQKFPDKPAAGLFAVVFVLTLFTFRYNVYFTLFLLLALARLDRISDKMFLVSAGAALFTLFSFMIKAKAPLDFLSQAQSAFFKSPAGLLSTAALAVLSVLLVLRFRNVPKPAAENMVSAMATGLFALWVAAAMGFSSITHEMSIARRNTPVEETWKQAAVCADGGVKKVLAPTLFWFPYQEKFRDTNSITLDYFYSGQKRARQCIERYRPDLLIVDDELRRRFFTMQPLETLFGGVAEKCASIAPTLNHSQLDVYRFHWDGVNDKHE